MKSVTIPVYQSNLSLSESTHQAFAPTQGKDSGNLRFSNSMIRKTGADA